MLRPAQSPHMSEKAKATRDRILSASLALFSQKGYLGATTREIASEAGVAELTLFRHFPRKELIIEEIMRSRSALSAVRDVMPTVRKLPCHEALFSIAEVFLATLRERRDLVKIFLAECSRYPEQVKTMHVSFMAELFETLASYLRDLQKKKIIRRIELTSAAQAFFGIFYAYFISREILGFSDASGISEEENMRNYINVFIHGIKGAEYGNR